MKGSVAFKVNQKVVCPSHGIGLIVGVEERGRSASRFYKLFFEKEKLTTFVPVDKAKELGLRRPCTKEVAEKVFAILSKASRVTRGMWSRRAQGYDAKIYSGSILMNTEVVTELHATSKDPNRSYSERSFYETALARVVEEIAIVMNLSETEAEERVIAALSKALSHIPVAEASTGSAFDDADLEQFEDGEEEDSEEEGVA